MPRRALILGGCNSFVIGEDFRHITFTYVVSKPRQVSRLAGHPAIFYKRLPVLIV